MNTLRTASYAGLAFFSWEYLITLQDEIDMMWPQTATKMDDDQVSLFFMRYFVLAIQINNTIIANILQARYPVPREICRLWLTYQVLVIYFLLGSVDVVLMIRVYAFYNRRRWIGIVLIFLLVFKIGLSSASAIITIPDQEFNATCLNENVPVVVMYFVILGEFIIQCIILGLTVFKHFVAVRAGWARTPLVSLLCRDGASAFAIIIAVLIGTTVYARFECMHDSAHFVFPAFVSILSCVGCRLIIGMQKLVVRPGTTENSSTTENHEFTTIIDSLRITTPSRRVTRTSSSTPFVQISSASIS